MDHYLVEAMRYPAMYTRFWGRIGIAALVGVAVGLVVFWVIK